MLANSKSPSGRTLLGAMDKRNQKSLEKILTVYGAQPTPSGGPSGVVSPKMFSPTATVQTATDRPAFQF